MLDGLVQQPVAGNFALKKQLVFEQLRDIRQLLLGLKAAEEVLHIDFYDVIQRFFAGVCAVVDFVAVDDENIAGSQVVGAAVAVDRD